MALLGRPAPLPDPCDSCRPAYEAWAADDSRFAKAHAHDVRALCARHCQRLPYLLPDGDTSPTLET